MISHRAAAGLVIALAAFPTPSRAQASGESVCMNHTLADCRAVITKAFSGTSYSVVSSDIDKILNSTPKYDVSGNLLRASRARVTISAPRQPLVISAMKPFKPTYVKRAPYYHIVTLSFDAEMIVKEVEVKMESDILLANTVDDYDSTNIFPLISPFLPSGCAGRTKSTFYKFLHEVLKPSIRMKGDSYVSAGSAADGYKYYSERASLCNIYMSYEKREGVGTIYMDRNNPSGKYEHINVTLWADPK